MQISDGYLTAITDLMTLYFYFFCSAPTSDNLTHDITIIQVRFGFAPAPYWSSVFVVYRQDTEKTREWFSSDAMSLCFCVARCHSAPPDFISRWKSCPFLSCESFKAPQRKIFSRPQTPYCLFSYLSKVFPKEHIFQFQPDLHFCCRNHDENGNFMAASFCFFFLVVAVILLNLWID